MENITDILCEFAFSLKYSDFSKPTVVQTQKFIVDYFAASLAGTGVNTAFNSAVLNVARSMGGNPQASVLFEKKKYPVTEAAFINAAYAHGADLDDGNRLSAGHIGAHVISSVFALAEERKLCWKDVLTAINVGYDFFNRLGAAAQPDLYNKGFHSTGVVGAVASGAACAKALGLNKEGIYDSVSLAAIQAGGLIIIDETGQGCKPVNPANAARIGVVSALLAEQNISPPRNPLESGKGWFHAFSDDIKAQYITEGLGKTFTIDESYLKLYPTCRHTHSCIDAAKAIYEHLSKERVSSGNIKKIQVFIYPSAIRSAGKIETPKNCEEAKFSIKFATAVALAKGKFDIEDLNPDICSGEIKSLAGRVELEPDFSMENRAEGIRGARVKIVLSDGKVFEKIVLTPDGEGKKSLSWEILEKKLLSCAEPLEGECQAKKVFDLCRNIDVESVFMYPAAVFAE